MAQRGFFYNALPERPIINDVIAADQSSQIKCFGWRIECYCTVLCIFWNRLRRNMLMSIQNDIRPDFIRNDCHIVFCIKFHCFFNLPALPDTSGWIMRWAENSCMNFIFHDFFFHIFKIHAPDSFFIFFQVTVHNMISVVVERSRKTNVCRCMNKYVISLGAKYMKGTCNTTKNSVFITDMLFFKSCYMISRLMPSDDAVKIFISCLKISVSRMFCSLDNCLRDCR